MALIPRRCKHRDSATVWFRHTPVGAVYVNQCWDCGREVSSWIPRPLAELRALGGRESEFMQWR